MSGGVESGARKLRHLAIIDRAQRRRTHGRGREAPPKIRFRNLLYFSRLTNQFTVIFAPIWDNFGTIFEIFGKGFILTYLSEFQYVISVAGITRGKVLGKGFS